MFVIHFFTAGSPTYATAVLEHMKELVGTGWLVNSRAFSTHVIAGEPSVKKQKITSMN